MLMLIVSVLLVLLLLAILFLQPRWLIKLILRIRPGVKFFAETNLPIVAITIDDGPHPQTTLEILAVLSQYQACATFFLIGERIEQNQAIVRQIIEQGHELGNHLMTDQMSIRLPHDRFEFELVEVHEQLTTILQTQVSNPQTPQANSMRWFRPGSGWYNQAMLQIAATHGYQCALGSIFPYDPLIPFSWYASMQIRWNLRPGAIIVLHDSGRDGHAGEWGQRTAATLKTVLPIMQQRGYQMVTLSTLFSRDLR
jgi:peptidoglycan/xylan/chitin deacetylase (PgdA/CDA1 family)